MPTAKRSKKNPGASTPISTSIPDAASSPPVAMAQASGVYPFKCVVADCEYKIKGFRTAADFEAHTSAAHQPVEEHIADPLAFFLEQTQAGLGLDENGQPKNAPMVAPPAMQKTVSKTGATSVNVKVEGKASSPAAASMVQGQNLQGSLTKRGIPSSTGDANPVSAHVAEPLDLWSLATVTPSSLRDTFGKTDSMHDAMAALGGPGSHVSIDEMIGLYVQSEAWTEAQEPVGSSTDESPASHADGSPGQNSELGVVPVSSENSGMGSGSADVLVHLDGLDLGDLGTGEEERGGGEEDMKMDGSWQLPESAGGPVNAETADGKEVDVDLDDWVGGGFDDLAAGETEGHEYVEIDWEKAFPEDYVK